jgi:hypothetical protein
MQVSATQEANRIFPINANRFLPFYPTKDPYEKVNLKKEANYEKRNKGIIFHKQVEEYLTLQKIPEDITDEFNMFLKFISENNYTLVECEGRLKNEKYIGCYDALFKDEEGRYILIDWKLLHDLDIIGYGFDNNYYMNISSYNNYSYQLHIYKYLLELKGIYVDIMLIVNFKENIISKYRIKTNKKWMTYIADNTVEKNVEIINAEDYVLDFGPYKDFSLYNIPLSYIKHLTIGLITKNNDKLIIDNELYNYIRSLNESDDNIIDTIKTLPIKYKNMAYLMIYKTKAINYARQYINDLELCFNCLDCKVDIEFEILCGKCKIKF